MRVGGQLHAPAALPPGVPLVVGEVELNLGLPGEEEKNDHILICEKLREGE
jgi:hypothetical protein